MSLPLLIIPAAEYDIEDANRWYERKREGLGEEFQLCVEEALDRIVKFPLLGREVLSGVRRMLVRRFPYKVIYRVDDDQIAVLAVYHTSRDPKDWKDRL